MNWYYAENGTQKGPLTEWDFAAQARDGIIKPDTLVWRDGLPDWKPLIELRPDLAAGADAPSLGGMAVPEQNKDLLVQQMREGVVTEMHRPGVSQYVGFWWRFLARFIDSILLMVVQQILQVIMMVIMGVGMAGISSMGSGGEKTAGIAGVGVMLLFIVISIGIQGGYYVWLTTKFGGTLGKMALGFKVVTTEGTGLTFRRSFWRWAFDSFVNGSIMTTIMLIPVGLVLFLGIGGLEVFKKGNEASMVGWIFALAGAAFVGGLVGCFPWWMAGFDDEKRTLHDRVCGTRVVRK